MYSPFYFFYLSFLLDEEKKEKEHFILIHFIIHYLTNSVILLKEAGILESVDICQRVNDLLLNIIYQLDNQLVDINTQVIRIYYIRY